MRIGTAGWVLSREVTANFPGEGRHLQRYARVLDCAEINSSFHRSHRIAVYERWAASTPPAFRFAAKLPRSITHDGKLRRKREPLARFLNEVAGLGERLAVLLVQLPPSLAFEIRQVRVFFRLLRDSFAGAVICEPRHATWFTPAVDRELVALGVGRAATNPARWPDAARPGGWLGPAGDGCGAVVYYRWHGEPRMYWSRYEPQWLRAQASNLIGWPREADCWCVFDNTASGAAIVNALQLRALVDAP
ncbi:MAG: DUF72 domain-containing protein [Pseudomonadota bacterium]|nr:DUF72 domain-containing protein [Pseudomonadota bacterium]